MSIFLPTIVGDIGFKAVYANLMTVPVYVTAYVCLFSTAFLSDGIQQRGIPIAIAATLSGIGYILLGVLHNDKARFACTFLVVTVSFYFPSMAIRYFSTFHFIDSDTN